MDKPNGGSAFPLPAGFEPDQPGMTLRDWFAGQAIESAATFVREGYCEPCDNTNETIALCAYQIADAMIAERSKPC